MKHFLFILSFIFLAGCGPKKAVEHGLKIPAKGLTFEIDEKDRYEIPGHNGDLTLELGKIHLGDATLTLKSGGEIIESGSISEQHPFTFTFDSTGYRLLMTSYEYNLISASVAMMKIEPFVVMSEQEMSAYYGSPDFLGAVNARFGAGYSFEVMQRKGHPISLDKAILNIEVGDITKGSSALRISLDNHLLHSAVLRTNESTFFMIGETEIMVTCIKYVDDLMDQGFFMMRTVTPEQKTAVQAANEEASSDIGMNKPGEAIVAGKDFVVPDQGMSIELNQRSSKTLKGKKKEFTITIGDITKGQTTINLLEGDKPILGESISEGDRANFKYEGTSYSIECEDLVNDLVGQDQGRFIIRKK